MKKKIIAILVISVLIVIVAAFGVRLNSDEYKEETENEYTQADKYLLGEDGSEGHGFEYWHGINNDIKMLLVFNDREIRAAVIYEKNQSVKNKLGERSSRRELTNKTIVSTCGKDIWSKVLNTISQIYDIDKIKKIIVLGDGAGWIKQGVTELKLSSNSTQFAIDKFHFIQAIYHLAGKDETYREILTHYALHDMRKDFDKVVEIIKNTDTSRLQLKKFS